MAPFLEELPGLGPAILRPVSEREEGLRAVVGFAGSGDPKHLIRCEVLATRPRWLGERAIRACVVAESREGNEHLAAVGDGSSLALVAQPRGLDEEGRRIAATCHELGRQLGIRTWKRHGRER